VIESYRMLLLEGHKMNQDRPKEEVPAAAQRKWRLHERSLLQPTGKRIRGEGVSDLPQDSVRNDEDIRLDICRQLSQTPETAAEDIFVRVDGGEVTLEGNVSVAEARMTAEKVAASIFAAEKINNLLLVPSEPG
jgi:osmotically-inducible protein OsmY